MFETVITATVEVPVPAPMGAPMVVTIAAAIALTFKILIDVLRAASARVNANARKVAFFVTTLAAAAIFGLNQFVLGASPYESIVLTISPYGALVADAASKLRFFKKKRAK